MKWHLSRTDPGDIFWWPYLLFVWTAVIWPEKYNNRLSETNIISSRPTRDCYPTEVQPSLSSTLIQTHRCSLALSPFHTHTYILSRSSKAVFETAHSFIMQGLPFMLDTRLCKLNKEKKGTSPSCWDGGTYYQLPGSQSATTLSVQNIHCNNDVQHVENCYC